MVFDQKQRQFLSQKMMMSGQMIAAIKLLGLSTEDLQEEIVKEVKKNPALVFKSSSFVSTAASEAGDRHQEFLENLQDSAYKTLQAVLLEQAGERIRDEYILEAAVRIIQNLDKNGFNWVPIEELFAEQLSVKKITKAEIKKALDTVRRLEPIGCACSGFRQSLTVQAKILCESPKTGEILPVYKKAYELTVLIIKKHYELLSAVSDAVLFTQKLARKKIRVSRQESEEAIDLIKSLNPYPGLAYADGAGENKFIVPVAEIKREGNEFKIIINEEEIPALEISPEYKAKAACRTGEAGGEVEAFLERAELFMDVLAYRNRTLLKILTFIVNVQRDFFVGRAEKDGSVHGWLNPLKQIDVAKAADLNPSTVSRICNEKYIRCQWGLFEIKDFFSNKVAGGFSKDYVRSLVKELIETDTERLSDLKIAKILTSRGIKIATRTVNKYRKELLLPSSYKR